MTTAYTSLLGLALPVTGELSGTWGDTVNNSITSLLDSAIAGTQTITADTTLTTTTGAANQSRQAILLCSPASVNITITAPAQSKIYTVINTSATYTVTVRGVGPTTGVTLAVSESAVVAWNGTDFIRISSSNSTTGNFTVNGNLVVTGNTTIGDADTDTITQAASYVTGTQLKSAKTATNTLSLAAYDVDGTAYTNLITLTASNTPTLALTSTGVGTINNMSIGATTAAAGTFTSLSDSGNLTFTGTGNRITGDFNNATLANRVLVQNSTVDAGTTFGIIPNGTGANAAYNAYANSDPTNSSLVQLRIGSDTSDARLNSTRSGTGTYLPMTFYTGGSEAMRITNAGSAALFGFGTSSPAVKLDVNGITAWQGGTTGQTAQIVGASSGINGGSNLRVLSNTTQAADVGGSISLGGYYISTTNSIDYAQIIGAKENSTSGNTAGYLAFGTRPNAGNMTERMRINSNGVVTIGATSAVANATLIANEGVVARTAAASGVTPYLQLYNGNAGTDLKTWRFGGGSTGALSIETVNDAYSSSTARVTVDSSGNVGIGTSSPTGKFEVSSTSATTIASISSTASQAINQGGLVYFRGAYTGTTATEFASVYGAKENGTAGNFAGYFAITTRPNGGSLTERMRIDSSGNLLVGTTSQIRSGVLSVSGVISTNNNINWGPAGNGRIFSDVNWGCIFQADRASPGSAEFMWQNAGSTERMRIASTGELLVGTTSAVAQFVVSRAANDVSARVANSLSTGYTSDIFQVTALNHAAGTGFHFARFYSSGPTPQFAVRGDGTVYAQNTTIQSISDARVKENVRNSSDGLQTIIGLRPVRFDFKKGFGNDRKNQLGFIAQEVQTVFPDAVDISGESDESGDPYKSVGPAALIPVLVKAIQEQQALITALTARITALESN
jgi:hypothetical protein